MKLSVAIPSFLILLILNSCWVQEAPKNAKRELHIVSDHLTQKDSALISDFGKKFKARVSILVLPADSIFSRFKDQRYNSGIDVVITENESLRIRLKQAGALRKLNSNLFKKTDRQFYDSDRLWLGLSHNPLVLVRAKDSSGYCKSVNWQEWHKKDSLRPQLKLGNEQARYYNQLEAKFPVLNDKKIRFAPGETVYTLSKIVSYRETADSVSPLPSDPCMNYLVQKKQYITNLTTVAVFNYSPNAGIAESFINFINAGSWSVASGRNQLPVNKEIPPNWYIQDLKVR